MKRVAGLDIIRALAVFFVISVHYFKNTLYYSIPMTGKTMIILTIVRWLFFICVPLFLLLTGYLSRNKEPNKEYFKGIKKVLISYFFISVVCILVRKFYFNENQRLLLWLLSPFNFTADGYSWYIEMYIGLFLLAPFLNILYKNLKDKKQKQLLIIILLILTGLPALFNNYSFLGINKIEVFPNWWLNIYPITYYFIGSYIAEFKPQIKLSKGLLYTGIIVTIQGVLNYILCRKNVFSWNIFGGYGSIITVIISIIVFITFYDKDIKNKLINKTITTISLCSLDIYLLSYLVDKAFYPYIKTIANTPKKLLLFMIPTILFVFLISFALAYIKKGIFDIIEKSKQNEEQTKEITKNLIVALKNSGVFLLILLTTIISISSISMLIKINTIHHNLFLSILITSLIYYLIHKKEKLKSILIPIIIALIVLISSIFINHNYLDLSYDGNAYHKDAVGIIKNGWNPTYEDYLEKYKALNYRDMEYIGDELQGHSGFWQTYYAKATWHIGASIYAFTNDIETGKSYNCICIYITIVLSLYLLYKTTHKVALSLIIAFLIGINPISIVQAFTYYNDAFMGNLLILLVFYMIVFAYNKKETNKTELFVIICSLLIILINIKFTGFGYAGLFCLPYFIIYLYKKMKQKEYRELIKTSLIFIVTVLYSVCIVGYSPYITNIKSNLPIFYPLMGENKVDIVSFNQTIDFTNKTTLYKFTKSMFSEVSNANEISGLKPVIKIPLTYNKQELNLLRYPDLRISGFGVLFSGIFILSIIVITTSTIILIVKKNKEILYLIIPLGVSILLILFISESWWARYSPYVYLIPIIALILCIIKESKINNLVAILLLILLSLNMAYFVKYNTIQNYYSSKEINERLNSIDTKITIVDSTNHFLGMLYNFDDKNIEYDITTTQNDNSIELYKWVRYIEKGE